MIDLILSRHNFLALAAAGERARRRFLETCFSSSSVVQPKLRTAGAA
jgi:hypothetical protein